MAVDDGMRFWPWFVENWSRTALPGGIVGALLLLTTQIDGNERAVMVAALLPIYMVHQYEEHARGGFIAFINRYVGKGLPVMTIEAVFWINIGLVWVLFLVVGAITRWITPELVLIPVYATLINALVHIAGSLKLRVYNPGLYTAVALFVPWGLLCVWSWTGQLDHPWRATMVGLAAGILIHAGIVVWALRRKQTLQRAAG